jgi:hypothetical protein
MNDNDLTHLYTFLIHCEKIVGSNTSRLPGRERLRQVMFKSGALKSGTTCPWRKAMKFLSEANMVEVKNSCYTKLSNITIGELICKIKNEWIENNCISNNNKKYCREQHYRKQRHPQKAPA